MIGETASKPPALPPQDRRGAGDSEGHAFRHSFAVGESVCSLAQIKNEGTYPHRDIGEILVREGDLGYVHESWSFLNEVYYTVEFVRHAVVVIMRGREMARIGGLLHSHEPEAGRLESTPDILCNCGGFAFSRSRQLR